MPTRLLEWIHAKNFPANSRLPSERDLAKECGVSRASVNREILGLIGEGVLRRDGYRLFLTDSARKGTIPPIHLLLTELELVPAAKEAAAMLGGTVIPIACRDRNDFRRSIQELLTGGSRGVLIRRARAPDALEALEARGTPVVVFDEQWHGHSSVSRDFRAATRQTVEHYYSKGHREIGLLVRGPHGEDANALNAIPEAFTETCLRLGLHSSAGRKALMLTSERRDILEGWRILKSSSPGMTGVICGTPGEAAMLIEILRGEGISIPDGLSLICLEDRHGTTNAACTEPPLTAVNEDEREVLRTAVWLLYRKISHFERVGTMPPALMLSAQPFLIERDSVASLLIGPPQRLQSNKTTIWADSAKRRRVQVEMINRRPHPILPGVEEQYLPIPLDSVANRSLGRQHGWLGDEPLLHVKSGRQEIHGVPFLIARGADGDSRALVLKSAKAKTGGGALLPNEVEIPFDTPARGVVILHGCAWAHRSESLAFYELVEGSQVTDQIEILPSGIDEEEPSPRANIADWHPSLPRTREILGRPYVVTDEGDPIRYERYLYTLRWMYRAKGKSRSKLRMRVADPNSAATLGILGITLVL